MTTRESIKGEFKYEFAKMEEFFDECEFLQNESSFAFKSKGSHLTHILSWHEGNHDKSIRIVKSVIKGDRIVEWYIYSAYYFSKELGYRKII